MERNDQKVCAVYPTGESMKLLEKLPVCQSKHLH
jgi:ribonuclease HIII